MTEADASPFPEHRRDLSRAEWQRGMGMVVMSHMCDMLRDQIAETPIEDIIRENPNRKDYSTIRGFTELWSTAYGLTIDTDKPHPAIDCFRFSHQILEDVKQHTFEKTVVGALYEGMNAQRYFPLNMAALIESEAAAKGVDGYKINSLKDIANLFRSPDFHDVLGICAFTRNGLWAGTSNGPYPPSHIKTIRFSLSKHDWFDFPDGKVRVSSPLLDALHKAVALNNAMARPVGYTGEPRSLDMRPTSGCPVNHTAPHPSVRKKHAKEVRFAAYDLDADVGHLIRHRERTPIVDLTLAIADIFERANNEYDRLGIQLDNTKLLK